jgi:hypothetical protein
MFPDGKGAQAVTYRIVTFAIGATFPLADSALEPTCGGLEMFREDLSFSGGGTQYGHVETLIGLPQKQKKRVYSTFEAVQRGSLVKLYSAATKFDIPDPIWPQHLVSTQPIYTIGHPERIGNSFLKYPLSWEWRYESALPMTGRANVWGVTY